GDLAAEREPERDRVAHGQLVHDRQAARQSEAERVDERVGLDLVEVGMRGVGRGGEHLRARAELDVHLEAHDRLEEHERPVEVHQLVLHRVASVSSGAFVVSMPPHRSASSASMAAPARYSRSSSNIGARICSPTGSPSSPSPIGSPMPGMTARFAGMVVMSFTYIASGSSSFSPSLNAVVGAAGLMRRSACWNAASKSRWMSVRTFCAEP